MVVDLTGFFSHNIVLYFIVLLVSSLPLYLAVKMMGGDAYLIETMIINVLAGGMPAIVALFVSNWIGVISFAIIIVVYTFFFRLTVMQAILTWFIQYLLIVIALMLFGGLAIAGFTMPKLF